MEKEHRDRSQIGKLNSMLGFQIQKTWCETSNMKIKQWPQ